MKTIQIVLNAILSKNIFEYILVDKNLHIMDTSENIKKYLDEEPQKDEDILKYLPELVGSEEEIKEVFVKQQCLYTLESVCKNDYYVNISVEYCDQNTAIILLQNITATMVSKQKLLQYGNESTLLYNTLKQVIDTQDTLLFVSDDKEIKFANQKFMEHFKFKNIKEITKSNLKIYQFFETKVKDYTDLYHKIDNKEKLIQIHQDIFTLHGSQLDSLHKLFTLKKLITVVD